jgi:sulfide:quinone oxidoreductase
MGIKQVVDGFAVAEQISAADTGQLAAEGFRSIVCNRPDGEASDQPAFAEIKLAAGRNGLQIRHLPVISGQVTMADVDSFAAALKDLPEPILAYCRSGTRSIQLWALATAREGTLSPDEIIAAAARAGYDLSGMHGTLQQLSRQG